MRGKSENFKKSSTNNFDKRESAIEYVTPSEVDTHIPFKKKFLDERMKAKKGGDDYEK